MANLVYSVRLGRSQGARVKERLRDLATGTIIESRPETVSGRIGGLEIKAFVGSVGR